MIDKILLLQLVFDSGMFVLICLTQLVIYPGFTYFTDERLRQWHKVYTGRMTIVVMPLMLGQLLCGTLLLYKEVDVFSLIRILAILGAWLLTFLMAVPLHNKINKGINTNAIAKRLVVINRPRTLLWTIVFITTIVQVLKSL